MAIFCGLLYFVAGSILDKIHEVFINPQGFLAPGSLKSVMFKEFLFPGFGACVSIHRLL